MFNCKQPFEHQHFSFESTTDQAAGLNEFAEDARGLVVVTHGCCCTLKNFYKEVGDKLTASLQH